ncbi:MAG TPA: virulence factor TspB C-terminal domain-related protein [Pseudomonas sp.]|nr:virulence factor TspB C-terminal domain-related protein [Pseudomonas sp.]
MGSHVRLFIRNFLFFVFFGWSSFSFADYYWNISSSPAFDSAQAACEWRGPSFAAEYNGQLISASVYTFYSDTLAQCTITVKIGNDLYTNNNSSTIRPTRQGTPCVLPKTYDQATRTCVSPPEPEPDICEPTIGQTVYHEYKFSSIGADGNPSTDPPVTVCKNQCQYAHTFGDFTSKRDFGPPDQLVGSFEYKGNGVKCTASASDPSGFNEPPSKDPVNNPPSFDSDNSCSGWETQPDGTLKRNCTSTSKYEYEGEVECKGGTAGSSFSSSVTCTPTKTPEKTQTDVSQESTKTNNPDGSTNTSTTTDTTKTNCKGLNPCTSTGKTETTTSGTNSDGSPGNDATTCTGTGCNPDNPKEGEEEGEEAPERTAAAGSCDAAFQCSGDPIDCAVLQKQKEQLCHAQEQADYEAKSGDIESMFQGDQFELESSEISAPSFINSGTRFLPSSCPPPESISLSSNGGHTFQLKYDPICRVASDFSFLIVAFASLFAALYVGRAFGGE